ncbi:MAG TPA: ATP-binding protein [Bryobacteraceae bacterium]|nr:ATP-binding protein [Bryobacteraceae bacterium]
MKSSSIRVRLTAWYFVSLALILTLFAIGAWAAMRASMRAAVDRDLDQRIRDVRDFTAQELSLGEAELLEELQEHSLLGLGGGLLQMSDQNGRVLFRSGRLKDTHLDLIQPAPGNRDTYYASRLANQEPVRVAARVMEVNGRQFLIQVAEPMSRFDESLARFERILLILAPCFLLLATAGGFWIASRALAPVDRITKDARAIRAGNLSARLAMPRARDELGRLTETLNEMLERIEADVRRIVQFTADASHELRAPLTLIHTAAEFSLRRERSREELVDAMRKIVRESQRTSRLVDDLLLLARADSQADALRLAPTDVSSTGREAADLATSLAQAKNIEISSEIPREAVVMDGDEKLLEQLWLILLDNAVKYTPEGGRINFAMRPVNSHLETTVRDTGIGIAPHDLPYVYDRFWRADKVRSRAAGGAGLGLAIARWIVQTHRGEIAIDSELGRGSEVKVRLPLAH